MRDKVIEKIIEQEVERQSNEIELIASENYVSADILAATGSPLTNKYAEGYPGKRYYDGTEFVDEIETVALDRLKQLFRVEHANVQPHSGSQANAAIYLALLKPGDKIMGMSLDSGGHLTHGHFVSSSGIYYQRASYEVNDNGFIDYEALAIQVKKEKPKMLICGYSSYSRIFDFQKFRQIANSVGAFLMADIAHIAGLVATGAHPSPVGFAHVISSTTHKTLRGARGGIIMTNDSEIAQRIDKAVFPGLQGGPLMHSIAGKAVAFYEAQQESFTTYINKVVKNAKAFANKFSELGVKVITGGTDNHLFTIDVVESYNLTGKEASSILHKNLITVNKNTIPRDPKGPHVTSGLRLGTPAMTSRGFDEKSFELLATLIDKVLRSPLATVKDEVLLLAKSFPIKNHY